MRIRVERHVQFSNCAIKQKQNVLSGTVRVPEQMCRKFNEDPGACCFGGNHDLIVERV